MRLPGTLRWILFPAVVLFFTNSGAQQLQRKIIASKRSIDGRLNFLKFELPQTGKPSDDTSLINVKKILGLGPKHNLLPDLRKRIYNGKNETEHHTRYNQYFNGLKVEFGEITV